MNAVRVETKAFTRELEWCARFIERRTTIPVLSNVLFQKRGDLLNMTATDLELGAITSIEVDGDAPDFEMTAPVHLLIKYLKKVDERSLSLTADIVMTEPCEGPHPESCGDTCSCSLAPVFVSAALRLEHSDETMRIEGSDAKQFPELPARPLATMQLYGLEAAIPRANVSISNDESRFTLNGALLVVQGNKANLVSTDGHRLSLVELKTYDRGHVKALIPRKALNELARLGDSAFFSADANHAFFAVGERVIVSRKLTGNFPDYERVLPTDLNYSTEVSTATFRKVLERVSLFADERSRAIALSVNGTMNVTAKTFENGAADGKIPIEPVRRLSGDDGFVELPNGLACPYSTGFNADYLLDFLKTSGTDKIRFLFGKAARAAEWNAPGWRYVLMPMRDACDAGDPYAVGDFEPVPAIIAALDALEVEKQPEAQPETASDAPPSVTIPDVPDAPVAPATRCVPIDITGIKARAIALRHEGVSLKVIAQQLNAPQSSVWRWTRGIERTA